MQHVRSFQTVRDLELIILSDKVSASEVRLCKDTYSVLI